MNDTANSASSTRIRVDLSHNWAFVKRNPGRRWLREGDEPADEVVDLPHSWNARDTFQMGVSYYRGYGAYRKVFQMPGDVPYEDYLWFIRSEGFYGTGDVWLNGRRLARIDGQYLGLCLATERHLPFSTPSILGIRLTNKCRSHILPGIDNPDFILYGGLAGRVWIEGVPRLHLDTSHTRIVTEYLSSRDTEVVIHFVVSNDWNRLRSCSIIWTIEDANAVTVATSEPLSLSLTPQTASNPLSVKMHMASPRVWSPSRPDLYYVRYQLMADGSVMDEGRERIGIRNAQFKPRQGFFLNDKRLELRGCNRHESIPGFGNALPANLQREDAVAIKTLGLNFVRLSHYPQHPAFLDACDELGILVYAEIASWKSVRRGRWLRSACRQMRDMVMRDRNRPSIILWGMGNESRSRRAYLKLRELVRDLDPTRPVTYAENHLRRAVREKTVGIADVWGVNYELEAIDAACDASIFKNVVVSECSNYPPAVRGDLEKETEQLNLIESDLKKLEGKPHVAGFLIWCFNDYATLRKERYYRHCGIVDAWRVPKMSAAFLKAKFTTEPFVMVFGDWGKSQGEERGSRLIHIFTNCDEIVVYRNDKPLMSLAGAPYQTQAIAFEPGPLAIVGRKDGRETTYGLGTFADASRIDLRPEKSDADSERRESVGIVIRITDKVGQVVTSWNGKGRVSVEGAAFARTYRDDNVVDIAGGFGRFFITGNGQIGMAKIRASCETLEPAFEKVNFS